MENSKGSRHALAWNKTAAAFYTFDKPSLSTQPNVYSPSPVNFPVNNGTLQLPSPNVTARKQLLPFIQRCAWSGCSSWLSFITVVIQAQLAGCQKNQVVQKSYVPHVACVYCIKLQHQEYVEKHTPDNNIYTIAK